MRIKLKNESNKTRERNFEMIIEKRKWRERESNRRYLLQL